MSLKVIYPLCTGLTRSSQLLEVKAGDILQGQPLLAKIYDPSYWDREEDGYLDPCRRADYEYSKEAAAYVKLQHMQGKSVTRFYGSYISNAPVDLYTNRQVCLVLLEYVDGICLSSLDEKEGPALSQAARQNILRKTIEIESLAYACDVHHRDMDTRNVMIRSANLDHAIDPDIQVVLIDFAHADIVPKEYTGAISPLIRWCACSERGRCFSLRGWIDWDWDPWLKECFADSKAYAPITPEMIDHFGGDYAGT